MSQCLQLVIFFTLKIGLTVDWARWNVLRDRWSTWSQLQEDQLYPHYIHDYFLKSSRHKDHANSIRQTSLSRLALQSLCIITVVPAPLNLSQLGLSVSYLRELKQAPNVLLTCWKNHLFWLATQLAPMKLASHLLWITVHAREEQMTILCTQNVCKPCDISRAWHCLLILAVSSMRKYSTQDEDYIFAN